MSKTILPSFCFPWENSFKSGDVISLENEVTKEGKHITNYYKFIGVLSCKGHINNKQKPRDLIVLQNINTKDFIGGRIGVDVAFSKSLLRFVTMFDGICYGKTISELKRVYGWQDALELEK